MFSNKTRENIDSESLIQEEVVQLVNLYNQKSFLEVIKKAEILSKQYPKTLAIWIILGSTQLK